MPNENRILIVDHDPDIHRLLAAALSDANYLIEDRFDGLEALSLLEAQPCDLVITDVRMPGLDGLELLRRIHQMRPGTKVLVMTAESTPAAIISSLRDQAVGYFSKPFSLDAVAETVALALRAPAGKAILRYYRLFHNGLHCNSTASWKSQTGSFRS